MNEEKQVPQGERVDPQKPIYGVKGGQKPPGSGRKPGTPNKRKVVPIEAVLERVAEDLDKENDSLEVTAVYRLYMVMHREDEALGLPKGTITLEMSLSAAYKLIQYEIPKKRAIEVTGVGLTGGSFVISTGAPFPEAQTTEEWASSARAEAERLEREQKESRLAELEAERELIKQQENLQ